jgi:hypothetical protein
MVCPVPELTERVQVILLRSAFYLVYLSFLSCVTSAETVAISAEISRRRLSIATQRSYGAHRRGSSLARNSSLVGT